jgi:beta-glucosidase
MITTENGKRGWTGSFFSTDAFGNVEAEPLETHYLDETMVFINDAFPVSLTERWRFHARGYLPPREESYTFEFGLSVAGRAKLFVDGELVVDNWTTQTRGTSFFNQGTVEEKGSIFLEALKRHEVYIEFANDRPDGTFICTLVLLPDSLEFF